VQDFKAPGSQAKQYFLGLEAVLAGSGNPAYPGGQFFNMFNLGKTPEVCASYCEQGNVGVCVLSSVQLMRRMVTLLAMKVLSSG